MRSNDTDRKLARKYHPDVSKLPDAEARFKEINEAWEVLQDPEKRKQYHQLRTGGWQQQQRQQEASGSQHHQFNESEFSDFFNSIFQQHLKRKGRDVSCQNPDPTTVGL